MFQKSQWGHSDDGAKYRWDVKTCNFSTTFYEGQTFVEY